MGANTLPGLSFKAADTTLVNTATGLTITPEGIVTAVVGVTGVVDSVNDLVEPGAYARTLVERKAKVCWAHSWEKPIGRVLHAEELPPGDQRLPTVGASGKPWPTGAGGLLCTMQINLKSDRGREAFEAIRFYSESGECAWSIGYVVPPGMSTKTRGGIRKIKSLDLYEISFVLHGAAEWATTLAVKGGSALFLEAAAERAAAEGRDVEDLLHALGVDDDTDLDALLADVGDLNVEDLDAESKAFIAELEAKYDTSPVGEPGGRQNWVDREGGLPKFVRAVAHAMIRDGHDESSAIAIAVATIKRWATGGGKVTAKTRAKAAAALAQWEKMKTSANSKSLEGGLDLHGWTPALDTDCKTTAVDPQVKMLVGPRLEGTLEERRDLISAAVRSELQGPIGEDGRAYWDSVSVLGTYDTHVVVTRERWNPPEAADAFEIPYTVDGWRVHLGEPIPVRLVVDVEPDGDAEDAGMAAAMDAVSEAAEGMKALYGALPESKAGRVLSGPNTSRIKAAVEALITVLAAAGVSVDVPQSTAQAPSDAAAAGHEPLEGKKLVTVPDPADLLAQLRSVARG